MQVSGATALCSVQVWQQAQLAGCLRGIAVLPKIAASTLQGLRWNSEPVDSHQFPKLRLKFKPNLVQLSGGMASLPITDPQVGCSTEASCTSTATLQLFPAQHDIVPGWSACPLQRSS